MFERYTEKARRVIFFARYEAAVLGSPHIETEHLLLGLMRDGGGLRAQVGEAGVEEFRREVEARNPKREKLSVSVDLPLSQESRRALSYGAEEADELGQKFIGSGHLVLGLLRIEGSFAAAFLIRKRIHLGPYREVVRSMTAEEERGAKPRPAVELPKLSRPPKAAALAAPIAAINALLDLEVAPLHPDQRLKRKPWSRKEAMGHLIDLAAVQHQWLARALTEPKVTAAGYPGDEWVRAQRYSDYEWRELVSLWLLLNRLVLHVMAEIPEDKLNTQFRIGVEEPCTLLAVIQRYVSEYEDVMGQMMAKLD